MIAKLILLFVLVPLADLMLLLMISQYVGIWGTLAIVVLTGAAGIGLFRWQLRSLARSAHSVGADSGAAGHMLSDSLMIFLGAALLVTPGLITDAIGISLMIPRSRHWHQRRLFHWLIGKANLVTLYSPVSRHDRGTVEGEVNKRWTEPNR